MIMGGYFLFAWFLNSGEPMAFQEQKHREIQTFSSELIYMILVYFNV